MSIADAELGYLVRAHVLFSNCRYGALFDSLDPLIPINGLVFLECPVTILDIHFVACLRLFHYDRIVYKAFDQIIRVKVIYYVGLLTHEFYHAKLAQTVFREDEAILDSLFFISLKFGNQFSPSGRNEEVEIGPDSVLSLLGWVQETNLSH